MNSLSMHRRLLLAALVISLLPLSLSAHDAEVASDLNGALPRAAAEVPASASEMASFVLSAVALVVAGIALARTRKHHHHPPHHS